MDNLHFGMVREHNGYGFTSIYDYYINLHEAYKPGDRCQHLYDAVADCI